MNTSQEFTVGIYSQDESLFELLRGLVGIEGDVVLIEEGDLLLGHLGCIIIDLSYPNRSLILDSTNDMGEGLVIAIVSANPFAASLLREYNRVEAFLSKPLNPESVQALLVGVRARNGQKHRGSV